MLTIWQLVPPVRQRSAAVAEASSGLSGRIVDSYTNIQSVKLFARAEREDGFVLEGFRTHIDAFLDFARTMAALMVSLTDHEQRAHRLGLRPRRLSVDAAARSPSAAIAIATSLVLRLNQMSNMILQADHLAVRERRHGAERHADHQPGPMRWSTRRTRRR